MTKSRKYKYILSIVFISMGFCASFSQQDSASDVLKKVSSYYQTLDAYSLDIEYAMYKGYTGKNLTESYNASIYKNEGVTQLKVLGSTILQFSKAQLTINDANKTLIYNEISNKELNQSPLDISAFLNFYKEVSNTISKNVLTLEMVLQSSTIPIPYSKVILHVDKNTYALKKQELFLSTKVPFVDKEGKSTEDVGRLEITFQSKTNDINQIQVPKLEDYIVLKPNKQVRLTQAYAAYTIIDQTNL